MEDWFIDLIKRYEGFKSKAYWDVDHWSIGYGSDTMPDGSRVKENSIITKEQAEALIPEIVKKKETELKKYFPNYDSLPAQTKYALIDQAYRGGAGSFSKSPKFVAAVNSAYKDGIIDIPEAKEIIKELDISKAEGGIKDRKQRRAAMLLGVYNPQHNSTVYSPRSEYKTFATDFYDPNKMWGQVFMRRDPSQNFMQRILDHNRETLDLEDGNTGTHLLGYYESKDNSGNPIDVVFPKIQQKTKSHLFRKPAYTNGLYIPEDPIKSAIQMEDTIQVPSGMGEVFTTQYKKYYQGFKNGGIMNYISYMQK